MLKRFKLGKLPARVDSIKLKMETFVDASRLPVIPQDFGHENLVTGEDWGILGNDQFGDCVLAGAAHETMMWNREAGRTVSFSEIGVLSDYSAITGFDRTNPDTDQGTDMQKAAAYRQKVGVVDESGQRHPVAAYLAIRRGRINEHMAAAYLFGAVGIGIQVPDTCEEQFQEGRPWDVVPGAQVEGGHYVSLVGRRKGLLYVVTWGKLQAMTPAFFQKYNDESVAYVSLESLVDNKSPEGFDAKTLIEHLRVVTHYR